jgi:nitroreductase
MALSARWAVDMMTPMSSDSETADRATDPLSDMGVMQTIARRISCRAYKADPVPEGHISQILEAARLAPSACNQQPWRFAVVQTMEIRRRIVVKGLLPWIQMNWAMDAPVQIVIGMERSFVPHRLGVTLSGVDYPWVDIGIAGEHLVLAATALGLGTCWIGWIRRRTVARIVGWSRSVKPVAVITVGYPQIDWDRSRHSHRKGMSELVRWL